MIRKGIGYLLILISFVVLLTNRVYLEPNEMQHIPYWIISVCALIGGFHIPGDHKTDT
jgi:hypothetical protein